MLSAIKLVCARYVGHWDKRVRTDRSVLRGRPCPGKSWIGTAVTACPCKPVTSANPWENVTICDTSGLSQNYPSPCLVLNGKWRCFLCALRRRMCPCPNSLCWAASGASCALPEVRLGWQPTAPSSCSLGQEALSGHNLLIDEFIICFPLMVKQALLTGWHAPLCYQL